MKKMLRVMISLALLMTILCTSVAFAEPSKLEMSTLKAMVASTNASIKSMVRIAQKTPYDDVDWLLAAVSAATRPVFSYARKIGAEVVCEYDYYEIDGRTVAIDPLKVINPRPVKTNTNETGT